ncbi:MAG: polysaccharide deacetylase family protein [Rhodobacteraceae bacterium]|nr:polysaccharide deacetylase family protein [Paracoccaceae bacterium]
MTHRFHWPEGKTCAVMISIAFDDGLDATARAPDLPTREKSHSVWKYGAARGVDRMLECLDAADLPATWFLPGAIARTQGAAVSRISAAQHEIACHGWGTERLDQIPVSERAALLSRARGALQEASGQAVRGFRLPYGNWPVDFAAQLLAAGFGWSHTLQGDDWPYLHPEGIVEIPFHSETEDRPYFQFNFAPAFPTGLSRIPSYEGVLGNWIAEFDACHRYGLCLSVLLRPEWTGTPGRIGLMRRLIAHMRERDDVWFATGSEVAEWTRTQGLYPEDNHPLNVYSRYLKEA